jgi:hypothetical protein
MTVASCVETDAELDRLEARHICPERALTELMEMEQGAAVHTDADAAKHTH